MPRSTTRIFRTAIVAAGALFVVGATGAHTQAQTPQAPLPYATAWPGGGETADAVRDGERQARLRRVIVTGKVQGWLSRDETRTAFRSLRAIVDRERELRAQGGGLTAAGREELDRRMDDLAQSLRWAKARDSQSHHYQSH